MTDSTVKTAAKSKPLTVKEINALRFDCVSELTVDDLSVDDLSDAAYPEADKILVNKRGSLIVADPLWLNDVYGLCECITDEAASGRLLLLSNKTQRAYGDNYAKSHSITTLNSVYSLLLSMPVKSKPSESQVEAIRELSILVAVTKLKERIERDADRAGNVTFVTITS